MAVQVEAKGVKRLARTLKQAGNDLQDLKRANRQAEAMVLAAALSKVPRRTGTLASTGRQASGAGKATVRFGSARVPYANPIHWGWPKRNIRPNPFLWNAVQETRVLWLEEYARNIQEIMDTVEGA